MSDYDTWDYERDALLNAVGWNDREQADGLLNRVSQAASASDLAAAAQHLEELRAMLVGMNLFRRWDNGIWCFASMIRLIRDMSKETGVPKEYQRFLDAIPSAHLDAKMSRVQRAFWYGM